MCGNTVTFHMAVVAKLFNYSNMYVLQDPVITNGCVAGPLREVVAVVGGEALLPCDVTEPGDSPILVLFYNGATGRPVYSIDSRSGPLDHSVHWSGLGVRAKFDLTSPTQSLVISPVEAQDEGDYRCRVDFRASPTRNLRVKLAVIVPPRKVSIINSAGLEVSGVIGPYPVGGGLVLTCRVLGGRPAPRVTWWHDSLLLDDKNEKNSSDVIQNILTLPALSRQHLHRVLTCHAVNSNLSKPIHTSVTLDMSFPPLEVSIVGTNPPMAEGQPYSLVCEAGGSRPPATLSWWMDGLLVDTDHDQVVKEGNVSRTTLHLTPTRNNDGAIVSCRAENPEMPGAAMEDIVKLSVHYTPRLQLRAGHNLLMTNIKEGDDVYFECVIQANPPVVTVLWFLQGEELHHNVSAGVILTNQSLVLQSVGRHSSGLYTCTAANQLGSATSEGIQLSVKFSPVCSEQQKWTYGSARGQQVNVSCGVDAHPEAHTFRWAFNTSTEVVYIPKNRTHFHRNRSVMAYTPKTHHDFGTLLCWAVNEVGPQPKPCVYLVVPAAVPEPVHNCSVWHNASAAGEVVVSCEAGWSGGLTQTFTLEVRQLKSSGEAGVVVGAQEQQHTKPHFTVTGLAPGTEYQLSVGASNSQGAATATVLLHHTPIDVAERRTSAAAAESFGVDLNLLTVAPIVAVVAGAVASLVLCSVVLALVIRSRLTRSRNHSHNLACNQPGAVYDKAASHAKSCDDGGFDRLQREPDLILVKGGREQGEQHPGAGSITSGTPAAGTMTTEHQVETPDSVRQEATTLAAPASTMTRVTTASPAAGAIVNPAASAILNPSSGAIMDTTCGAAMMNRSSGMIDPSGAMLEYSGGGITAVSSGSILNAGDSVESRMARPMSVASPATLSRYQGRVGRSASCTGRGSSFTFTSSSTLPRRSSAVALNPEFFPLDLSTSRESCV
ncbi:neural cell adhesion molecule 2 [Procambarus clarkii]|uniref:neural cell adhesion molecule 2 n=1 Tax=Procambarus clarkii TaxID=6728 RepID=UPI003743D93E